LLTTQIDLHSNNLLPCIVSQPASFLGANFFVATHIVLTDVAFCPCPTTIDLCDLVSCGLTIEDTLIPIIFRSMLMVSFFFWFVKLLCQFACISHSPLLSQDGMLSTGFLNQIKMAGCHSENTHIGKLL